MSSHSPSSPCHFLQSPIAPPTTPDGRTRSDFETPTQESWGRLSPGKEKATPRFSPRSICLINECQCKDHELIFAYYFASTPKWYAKEGKNFPRRCRECKRIFHKGRGEKDSRQFTLVSYDKPAQVCKHTTNNSKVYCNYLRCHDCSGKIPLPKRRKTNQVV